MVASSFGQYPAQAIEPFPVETQLANILGQQSPGEARLLLNQYGMERDTAERQYADLMQQQRGLAYQQLHSQMMDRAAKTIADAAQHPEMAPWLFGSQYGQEVLGPGNPTAYGQFRTNLENAATLARAKTAGEAIAQGSAGGGTPDLGQMSIATGLQFNQTVPRDVQVATIGAQGRVAAAEASAQRGGAADEYTVNIDPGTDPVLGKLQPVPVKLKFSDSPDVRQQKIAIAVQGARQAERDAQTARTGGTPGGTSGGTSTGGSSGGTAAPTGALTGPGVGKDLAGRLDTLTDPDMTERGSTTPSTPTRLVPAQRDPGKSGTLAGPPAQTGGAQAAPVQPKVPDTPQGSIVMGRNPQEQQVLARAQSMVNKLPQAEHDMVIAMMADPRNKSHIPAVVARGGEYYYVGNRGQLLSKVP